MIKTRLRLSIMFLLFCAYCETYSQTYDFDEIAKQVTQHNNDSAFDQTILLLEHIVSDKKATHFERYQAYNLKYQTYKRLFIYDKAKFNLELALEEGLKSDQRALVSAQVKLEKLFLAFDALEFEEVNQLLLTITDEELSYVTFRTQAYYYAVLGMMEVKQNQLEKADEYYKKAIVLLEEHDPQNLPLIYRKQIDLYRRMNQYEKAITSFEQGLFYAKAYNIDVYVLNMYFDLTYFYKQTGNFDKAVQTQEICNLLAKAYNEKGVLGRLNVLESQLMQERIKTEEKQDRLVIVLLTGSLLLVLILLILLFRYRKRIRKNKKQLEEENERLRTAILDLYVKTEEDVLNPVRLTDRQSKIIELVKLGKTNKEIGNLLFVSENTVKYHLKNIYEVLRVNSRVEL
ncbi:MULTISPECIES: LuxR C-terminal-related transcriptional regulator [unclassified Myroides]|uniref:LuxR C-terminal-related transcriptional regulator n=1 Tax=unclassified Myroides TaxID=2642485 RepID=UPI003D2F6090